MTTFPFDDSIPAANNNPSADQSKLLINNDSTKKILAVDHITFQAQNGGTHQQVTYIDKFPALAQVDPTSVSYTNVGIADSTHPQNFWRNSQGIFPLSAIRAFTSFLRVTSNGAVTQINGINVDSVTSSISGTTYVIALTPGATNSTNFSVMITLNAQNLGVNFGYTYTISANTITITTSTPSTPFFPTFTVLVIQI